MADPVTLRLLKQVESGNSAALDSLFARDRSRLRRLLSLRATWSLRARFDLDDLVQETYLEALKQYDSYSYQGKDSFFRWLAAIAIHRTQNLDRTEGAKKRDLKREVRICNSESAANGTGVSDLFHLTPGPRTLATGADEVQKLDTGLARLSEDQREVILQTRFEGLSIAEVAKRIGRTENATALLLSRALRKLKRLLQPPTGS